VNDIMGTGVYTITAEDALTMFHTGFVYQCVHVQTHRTVSSAEFAVDTFLLFGGYFQGGKA
jgi:hypothetical protein